MRSRRVTTSLVADVDPPIIVTIREVVEETLANPKGDDELKQIVYFPEFEKGYVLNWINAQTIAKLLGSESFDDWPGGKVVLYDDPTVVFAGYLVGGIRVRAVRKRPSVHHRNQHRRRSHRSQHRRRRGADFDDAWPEDDETGEEAAREVG